jgi:hypothetical protein
LHLRPVFILHHLKIMKSHAVPLFHDCAVALDTGIEMSELSRLVNEDSGDFKC